MPKNRVRFSEKDAVCLPFARFFPKSSPVHRRLRTLGAVARPLAGAAAAKYVDVYMEAIKWDNAAKLYEEYSKQA
jgi:hypothetical protein